MMANGIRLNSIAWTLLCQLVIASIQVKLHNFVYGQSQLILAYTKTWDLLLAYDKGGLKLPTQVKDATPKLNYVAALSAIESLKVDLGARGDATHFFGQERDGGLDSILNNCGKSGESTIFCYQRSSIYRR